MRWKRTGKQRVNSARMIRNRLLNREKRKGGYIFFPFQLHYIWGVLFSMHIARRWLYVVFVTLLVWGAHRHRTGSISSPNIDYTNYTLLIMCWKTVNDNASFSVKMVNVQSITPTSQRYQTHCSIGESSSSLYIPSWCCPVLKVTSWQNIDSSHVAPTSYQNVFWEEKCNSSPGPW